MSSRHFTLKVNPPNALPPTGVSPVSFKAWRSLLVAYLRQDRSMTNFLPGGPYATWSALEGNATRLFVLADADTDAIALRNRQPPANDPNWDRQRELDNLLALCCRQERRACKICDSYHLPPSPRPHLQHRLHVHQRSMDICLP